MDMPTLPTDAAFTTCKRQLDVALGVAEAIVEAAEKAREIQLAAAVDAHAALEATRKSLDTAKTLPELVELQSRFLTGNAGKVFAYWGALAGNVRDAQTRIATILAGGVPGAFAATDVLGEIRKALEKAA
jgi:hypothetical protein